MLEDIAADEDGIRFVLDRYRDNRLERLARLLRPRVPRERLAHVPVAGVEDSHRSNFSKGSPVPVGASASLTRVAQAGKGKVTSSGTGKCGCCKSIVPGFRSAARWRAVSVRKPYSAR